MWKIKAATFLNILELAFFSDMLYIWVRFCMKLILLNLIEVKDMEALAIKGYELIGIAKEENIVLA